MDSFHVELKVGAIGAVEDKMGAKEDYHVTGYREPRLALFFPDMASRKIPKND